MEVSEYKEPLENGAFSAAVAIVITYGVAQVYPTSELTWALIAVAAGSFFSGFFSSIS